MNSTQKTLLGIFNAAIHNRRFRVTNESIHWNNIIEEADAHKIKALIYSALNQDSKRQIDNRTLTLWRQDAFYRGLTQRNHLVKTSKVLAEFNKNGLQVICLKGLVVRELYPTPEMRIMSDADILVKNKADLDKARKLIIGIGYEETGGTEEFRLFNSSGNPSFEIRITLCDSRYYKGNISNWEKNLWDGAMKVKLYDVDTLSLSWEDLTIHLLLQMATYMINSGFGLRQLADIILLVEKKGHEINWSSFRSKIKSCGLEKFTLTIFNLCNRHLNMELPKEVKCNSNDYNKYGDMMLEQILNGGAYGNRDLSHIFANQIAIDSDDNIKKGDITIRHKEIIFPKVEEMSDRYNYAKRYKLLKPIAYIHHLFAGLFRKEYKMKDKLNFITNGSNVASEKNELIKWLEI